MKYYSFIFVSAMVIGIVIASGTVYPEERKSDAPKVEQLIRQLGSPQFEVREAASKALVKTGAVALEPLRQAAKSRDAEVSRRAAACIAQIEHDLEVLNLIKSLKDPDPKVRVEAMDQLIRMRQLARASLPALVEAMDDQDLQVRQRVLVAFWSIPPETEEVARKLTKIVKNKKENESLRGSAVQALGFMRKKAESAIPCLIEMLDDEKARIRGLAARALGNIGKEDRLVAKRLIQLLEDSDPKVVVSASSALGKIGKSCPESVPALIRAFKTYKSDRRKGDYRYGVLSALAEFGPSAAPSVKTMVEILSNAEEGVTIHLCAIDVLEAIGPGAKEAVPLLRSMTRDLLLSRDAERALRSIERAD